MDVLVASKSGKTTSVIGPHVRHRLPTRVARRPHIFTMSGEQFPSSVVVAFDDRYYEGCGQDLEYLWKNLE